MSCMFYLVCVSVSVVEYCQFTKCAFTSWIIYWSLKGNLIEIKYASEEYPLADLKTLLQVCVLVII